MKNCFPAEWHPQGAVVVAWPHEGTDWAAVLAEVVPCYVGMVREMVRWERVIVVCPSREDVLSALGEGIEEGRLVLLEMASNDTWVRDYGPVSVFSEGRATVMDFRFNGWGLKFAAELDDRITLNIYRSGVFGPEVVYHPLGVVLEGGSLESDGRGTLLTTAQCLLSSNRNNYKSTEEAEELLKILPGIQRILWLHHGYLAGDDTDGHIDTLARFCDPETIAYVCCSDEKDSHFAELALMEKELQAFRTAEGRPYRLIPLPMAAAVYEAGGRLPATYANFLIMNGAVLVPTYDSPLDDAAALKALQAAFPDRKVVGINCLPLIKQHGSLHCATMQIPVEFISK